jgi:apolipoprotein D and lipocalin family protein
VSPAPRARASALRLLAALVLAACAGPEPAPLAVAEGVDLERYLGSWYEIASYPTRFQRGCSRTRAHYARGEDGTLLVRNECMREGELATIEGTAWVADEDPAKLRVRFFWPFSAPYWILALDPDYRWALVGTPDRGYLWVLARAPALEEETFRAIVDHAAGQGFDPARLVRTEQEATSPSR